MPKKAGIKVATPLIAEFTRWLQEDVGRAERTVTCYGDAVEFFAGVISASTDRGMRLPPAVSTPNELRYVSTVEPSWGAATLGDVEAFVREPLHGTSRAPSQSRRRTRTYALKAFFQYLEDHEVIERDPTRKLRGPGVTIGKPKPVPDAVWLHMWDRPLSVDDRVLLGLGYYVGLRRHEMVGIESHHFDLDTRRVADFTRKGGKTNEVVYGGNLDRIARKLPHLGVRLDEFEAALSLLVGLRHGERLLALTEHVGVHEVNSAINRRVAHLSSGSGAHITPHQLRHSFGTNLLRAGVPAIVVSDQMAHSSLETTRGYLDTNQWYDTDEAKVG